jgi:hypothetical protein
VPPAQVLPDIVPPHDLATERALLGSALLFPEALDAVRRVGRDDFHAEKHRLLYDAILAVGDRAGLVDAVTVHAELVARGTAADVGGQAGYRRGAPRPAPDLTNLAAPSRRLGLRSKPDRHASPVPRVPPGCHGSRSRSPRLSRSPTR